MIGTNEKQKNYCKKYYSLKLKGHMGYRHHLERDVLSFCLFI